MILFIDNQLIKLTTSKFVKVNLSLIIKFIFKRSSVFERPYASTQNYTPSTNYEAPPYKNTKQDVYEDDISLQSYSSSRISGEDSYASQSPTSSDEG